MIKEEVIYMWFRESEVRGCATFVCKPVRLIYKMARKSRKDIVAGGVK